MPKYEPFDWYAIPLYYDMIFDTDTTREADFLESVFDRYVTTKPKKKKVIEPACGSGRLLVELGRRDFDCTGFDLSDGMLVYAKKAAPDAKLFKAQMQAFKAPRGAKYDLAFNPVSTFKYLLTEEDAAAHLCCIADCLKPGGVYCLGLHTTEYDRLGYERERWVAERDGVKVVCNIQGWPPNPRKRVEKVRSRMTVTEKSETKYYESLWDFRTYDGDELASLLKKEPRLELVDVYGFDEDGSLGTPIGFDEDRLDHMLVLRRL